MISRSGSAACRANPRIGSTPGMARSIVAPHFNQGPPTWTLQSNATVADMLAGSPPEETGILESRLGHVGVQCLDKR